MSRWKCTVCGYTYSGEAAQEKCPYCSGHCTVINVSTDCRENPEECQRPPE